MYSISASGKGYARFGAIQIMASVDGRPFSPPSAWSPRSTSEKPPDQQQNNLVAVDVATMNDTSKSEGNNSQFRPITADTILLPKEGFSPKSKHRKFFNDNGKSIMNTVNHLQKANEIGGTDSTPPLATIVLVAIKIG